MICPQCLKPMDKISENVYQCRNCHIDFPYPKLHTQLNNKEEKPKMEEQTSTENWRDNVSTNEAATLKIQDGETIKIALMNEGESFIHVEYGKSIVFTVKKEDLDYRWYVNPNNFALLKQIKELGKLAGKIVEVSRVGSKKSDTRYTIKEI